MKEIKIIFMGTPDFATNSLKTIYEMANEKRNDGIKIKIPLVVTREDKKQGRKMKLTFSDVKKQALSFNLNVLGTENVKSEEFYNLINNIKPDLIVVTAFGKILPASILNIPSLGCINVHASLLPKYRGASPINEAIIKGEVETGISTMFMEEGLDTGDIILQDKLKIKEDDNSETLFSKLAILSEKTLKNTINLIIESNLKNIKIPVIKQNNKLATYSSIIKKETGHINFNENANNIVNLIRGLIPWPKAYALYENINFKILKAKALEYDLPDKKIGEIVKCDNKDLIVKCKKGCISILEIQFPGKKPMNIETFLRGNSLKEGTILQ